MITGLRAVIREPQKRKVRWERERLRERRKGIQREKGKRGERRRLKRKKERERERWLSSQGDRRRRIVQSTFSKSILVDMIFFVI